jgi:hypothetical protein
MPANLDIVGACENIRREAETLAGQNYAFNLKRTTGALDWITSAEGGADVDSSLISYQAGRKLARAKVLYDQRTKECQISDNCDSNVCDAGTTPVRKEVIFDIDNCVKTPVRAYSNDDMIGLCLDTQTFIQRRAGSDLRASVEFLDSKILALLDDQIGINYEWDGTTTAAGAYKDIQLIKTNIDSQGQPGPLPGNFAEIMLDYRNNQLLGRPAAIGQGRLEQFALLHGMSCCNATTPYGESNGLGDIRFYSDQGANSVLGSTDRFLVIAPGIIKLMTFNENANINIEDDSVAHTVIQDPNGYPFQWNMDMYWDHCDKVWKVQYSLLWGLFNTFQQDSFAADGEGDSPDTSPDCNDPRDGMLGVFGYRATAA